MVIPKLDKSEFRRDNFTEYGNIAGQMLHKDYRLILGYSYETEYSNIPDYGGVMFMTPRNPLWALVKNTLIDQMLQDLGETDSLPEDTANSPSGPNDGAVAVSSPQGEEGAGLENTKGSEGVIDEEAEKG